MQGRWFIGVDLAWGERNASGFAALSPGRRGLRLRESAALGPLEAIAERIRRLPGDWVIAIDATPIVPNETGSRPCDREVSRQYGSRHAGAYPASLRKLGGRARAMALVELLAGEGLRVVSEPSRERRAGGRWAMEVYPHPAMIELFGLKQILKYKRGRVAQRRRGQGELAARLRRHLPGLEPSLVVEGELAEVLSRDLGELRGRALKSNEDVLDAVFCAYLAAHCWAWGGERNRAIGDGESGSIIVPVVEP